METKSKDQASRERTYDHIPVGVLRIDTRRTITYANQAILQIVGVQDLAGTSLMALVGDPESRKRIESELGKRFKELEGSRYEIELTRPTDGRRVPVVVSAAPEFADDGALAGSVAFIRDLSVEKAHHAIHQAIEGEKTTKGMLRNFAQAVRNLIPYECLRVTVVSRNREHLMVLFEYPEVTSLKVKWWPMPPVALEYLARKDVHDLDFDEWFRKPEAQRLLAQDEGTKAWRKLGFKHSLVRPVLREGEVVAFVAMETKDPGGYSESQLRMCEQLPVAEAVLSALQANRQRDLEFAIALIRKMGEVSDNIASVADVLVRELQGYYEWEHVSIFQADEDSKTFRLLAQAVAGDMRVDEGYTQALDAGLLGRAYTTGTGVNVGDVHAPSIDGEYIVGIEGTQSELCLPIPGKRIRWVLNVESSRKNSFADEEQAAVEFLVREAGFILERTALLELKTAILSSIKDAVLQTNTAGEILEANKAASELLGVASEDLIGRNFGEFIEDGDVRTAVLAASESPRAEIDIRRENGQENMSRFPALLSASRLPSGLGGKVFVASDLTYQKRVEQTELLKEVFGRVAMETRAPLALVSTWIRRAAQHPDDAEDLLDKSVRQLKKMDVTLERVMRVASTVEEPKAECTRVDVAALVGKLIDQFPKTDAGAVDREFDEDLPPVTAVRHDLEFCVGNIFGVLLRSRAQEDTLVVSARREEPGSVLLELRSRRDKPVTEHLAGDAEPLRDQMALGEGVVKAALTRMGGSMDTLDSGYAIHLPIAG